MMQFIVFKCICVYGEENLVTELDITIEISITYDGHKKQVIYLIEWQI